MKRYLLPTLFALVFAFPAFAQDALPTVSVEVTEAAPVETPAPVDPVESPVEELPAPLQDQFALILENLVRLLFDGTFIPFLATGIIVITNLFKAIFARLKINANPVIVALFVQVGIWLAYVLATRFGYGDFFTLHWDSVIDVLRTFIPLVGGGALAHSWYERSKAADNPILGYSPQKPAVG